MELSEVGVLENTYSKALVLTFTKLTYQAQDENLSKVFIH